MKDGVWEQLLEEMESFTAGIREIPVSRSVTPGEVRAELGSRYSLQHPVPLETVMADVSRWLRAWSVHVTHPRYFGLFNPSVRTAGIVGDALAALYNPQLAAWSHAPAAQELERLTLRELTSAIGMDPDATIANFTTGGAEANLSAVLSAIAQHYPEWGRGGVAAIAPKPAIYITAESHHSFVKIVRMTGLGTDVLRDVPTSPGFAMDPEALSNQVRDDIAAGWRPLVIVATAGTTATGAIDPIPAIADTAEATGAWLHVDGAWGASAALVPRLRSALDGIERADSVTWDAHKWLSVPMGAGMFFCRRPEAVKRAFGAAASYMPAGTGEDALDPYLTTAQWSRRAIGLKVFMSLAELGMAEYGDMIDHQARMGDQLRTRLNRAGWLVVNDTPLPLVCFTHPILRSGRTRTDEIISTLNERGRVWISDVTLADGERVLRACITSFRTVEEDLDSLIHEIDHALQLLSR